MQKTETILFGLLKRIRIPQMGGHFAEFWRANIQDEGAKRVGKDFHVTAFTVCLHKADAEGVISLTSAHALSYKGPIPIMLALQSTSSKPKCIPKGSSPNIRL